ncbi:MAG: MipA/OmpV family protein [Paracoccus sp. (in: a-proteobacteria)]|nr:MipA/OmpV family protein [Paracoccus sp. (in: a-proteobacteria)]
MKSTLSLIAALAGLVALPAAAQDLRGGVLSFDLGLGARSKPEYLGAADNEAKPWVILRNFQYSAAGQPDRDGGGPQGFSWGPDFELVNKRDTGSDAPERLRGLDKIGYGLELGLEAGYRTGPVRFYTGARKAVGGHKGVTGELGLSYTFEPAPNWSVISAFEARYGNSTYMDAYFGVSEAESQRSGLREHSAGSGMSAYAASIEARYRATDNWSLLGRVEAERLTGDAADSPIVADRDQVTLGLGVVRSFTFGF